MIIPEDRQMAIDLIDEAVTTGARQHKACEVIEISTRTFCCCQQQTERRAESEGSTQRFSSIKNAGQQTLTEGTRADYRDLQSTGISEPATLSDRSYIGRQGGVYGL